jgi:hypothetical protein
MKTLEDRSKSQVLPEYSMPITATWSYILALLVPPTLWGLSNSLGSLDVIAVDAVQVRLYSQWDLFPISDKGTSALLQCSRSLSKKTSTLAYVRAPLLCH